MDTDELIGALRCLGQSGDRQRRRITGKDGRLRDDRFRLRRHLRLDPAVLEHGFDHQVATFQIGVVGRHMDPLQDGGRLLLGHATAGHALVQQATRIGLALLRVLEGTVQQHDLLAGIGRNIGDAGAHHARAQDAELLHPGLRHTFGPAHQLVRRALVDEKRADHVAGDRA